MAQIIESNPVAPSGTGASADAISWCAPDVPKVGDRSWAAIARRRAERLRHRAEVMATNPSLDPLVTATKRRAAELELLAAVVDDSAADRARAASAA